jgi:hypothetical protein
VGPGGAHGGVLQRGAGLPVGVVPAAARARGQWIAGAPCAIDFRAMPESNGPYLSYAAVCERVLHEADGVLSLIRIIDRVTVTVVTPSGADVPAALIPPPPPIPITFVVGLKSGGYTGTVPVKVRIDTPSGFKWPEFETSAQLEGEERGANIVLPIQFPALDEGIYWFVVEVSGEILTRVPLRIIKQVVTQTVPPQPS